MLSLIQYPPKNKKKIRTFGFNDPMKRFAKQDNKWIFKQFGGKYHDCSSPFCYFHNIEQTLINAVTTVTATRGGPINREKRRRAYVTGANEVSREGRGEGIRVRLGWCFTNYVRTTFPEPTDAAYKGFKVKYYREELYPKPGDSSDSDTTTPFLEYSVTN